MGLWLLEWCGGDFGCHKGLLRCHSRSVAQLQNSPPESADRLSRERKIPGHGELDLVVQGGQADDNAVIRRI